MLYGLQLAAVHRKLYGHIGGTLFTAEKELLPCETDGCGIIISEADFQNGKLIFNFSSDKGRNSGINNVVVFKALSDVENEEITYQIQ